MMSNMSYSHFMVLIRVFMKASIPEEENQTMGTVRKLKNGIKKIMNGFSPPVHHIGKNSPFSIYFIMPRLFFHLHLWQKQAFVLLIVLSSNFLSNMFESYWIYPPTNRAKWITPPSPTPKTHKTSRLATYYYNYSLMSVTSIWIINIVTCLGKTTNYNVPTETNDATSYVQSQQCIPQTTGAKSKEVSWWNESCPTSSAGGHLHWCGPGSIFSPIYIYDRNKHLCCWLYCHQTFWAICSKAIEFTHQQTEQNG